MIFSTVPARANGGRAFASWWNVLRTALIAFLGAGAIEELSQSLSNNAAATNVTGVTCDSASYRALNLEVEIYRKTDTAASEKRAWGFVICQWSIQNASWSIIGEEYWGAGDHGLTFSLTGTTVMQLQVATDNKAGSNHVGKLGIKGTTFNL